MDLPLSLAMSSSGLAAKTVSMQSLHLLYPFFVLLRYQQILRKRKIRLTSFNYVLNSALFDVFMLIIFFTVARREGWRLLQLSKLSVD
jgi:hypothetical protein